MDSPDPLLISTLEEKPPPNPYFSALKRGIWLIITLLVILSLLASTLLPILIRREPRPENEIQTHWISNQREVNSVLSITNL